MAKYKFPLQKLLDIREEKEEKKKISFMEALRERKLAQTKLDELKEKYIKYNVCSIEDDIFTKKVRDNYLNALTNHIVNASKELEKNNENVNYCREELKKSQIDRKTVAILKEKREAIYLKEEEDKERKANDEFALYAYLKNIERR